MNLEHYTSSSDPAELLRALTENAPREVRDTLEEWYDAAQVYPDDVRQDGYDDGYAQARADFEPGADAWREIFDLWEDEIADGRWPAADPSDGNLQAAMFNDFRRGAEALQLVRDIAAGKFVDAALEAAEFLKEQGA